MREPRRLRSRTVCSFYQEPASRFASRVPRRHDRFLDTVRQEGGRDARHGPTLYRGRLDRRGRARRFVRLGVGRGTERDAARGGGACDHRYGGRSHDQWRFDRDLLTFHNELFNAANTDVVGSNQGECVRIEVGVSWECRWVNFLEGGSITVEGPFLDAGPSALAITGGTGAYRGARGSMRLVAANDAATEFDFIFRMLVG